MSFIQETILFLSAWVHVHLISVGSSIYSIHLISIRRCFSVEVRSCPRDMQGHSIKQIAPEFWPRQPQSFLGPPWALSACSLLHMEVFTVLPCKGDLQSHHPAVIPYLLVWAPCIHKGKEGLWGAQGTDASIAVHVYMHTYMYTYRYSWVEHGSSPCRQQYGTACHTLSWGAPGPPRSCIFFWNPEVQAVAPFQCLYRQDGAWLKGGPKSHSKWLTRNYFGHKPLWHRSSVSPFPALVSHILGYPSLPFAPDIKCQHQLMHGPT